MHKLTNKVNNYTHAKVTKIISKDKVRCDLGILNEDKEFTSQYSNYIIKIEELEGFDLEEFNNE